MAAPEISVITPAYNCAAYLPECVASVARQRGVTVEHIVVDDASSDDTRRIMGELASVHPHLKIEFLERNIGQARARNFAMSRATGRYILFLDSDDMLEGDEALAELAGNARGNDADLVHFQYNRMPHAETTVTPAVNALTGERRRGVTLQDYPRLLNNTSCWQMLYRHKFLRDENLLFSHELRQREDRPFFLECLLKAKSVNVVQTRALRYRVRPDSTMRRLDLEQLDLFNTHLRIVSELMEGLGEDETAQALRRANTLYYMHVTMAYWAPFLLREEVRDTPEAAAFVAAFAAPGWRSSDLFIDRIMENIPLRHRDSGTFDVLAHYLSTGQKEAAFALMRDGRMTPTEVERLGMTYRDEAREAGFRLSPEAFGQFASNVRLLPLPATSPRAERPRPRLILHAGATKTGSSSLQKFLEINRFRLLHDHGVYYPMTGLENGRGPRGMRTSGHAALIGNLLNGQDRVLDMLDEELDQLTRVPETVILSAENILSARFWERGNVTGRLAPHLGPEHFSEVTVLAFLRAPVDWLESMYGECIASPGLRMTLTPEEFARSQENERLLDFDHIGGAFHGGMPQARLVFRSYDTLRALKRDIVQEMFDSTGLDGIRAEDYDRPGALTSNASIPKPALRMIRAVNSIPMQREPAARLNARIIAAAGSDTPRDACFYDSAAAREIIARHRDRAVAFFAHHHPDFEPGHLTDGSGRRDVEELDLSLSGTAMEEIASAIAQAQAWTPEAEDVRVEPPEEVDLRVAELFEAHVDGLSRRARREQPMHDRIEAGRAILASGLFDGFHYLEQAPGALNHPGGPLMHYLETCRELLLDPNRNFSTRDYLIINTDVARSEMNPFHHFVAFGMEEGRQFVAA
ncbi:glycosyltransferase family 2 protein [Salipiger mucosus]|uniref:Glycosyltransferase 2-like domain-containing protein n=1 Tax=Salipiger mucosus DSM 16094 TaxID=1123237 RepID=S9RBQ5_9RHOB|nr:glycosyltransferase family 2 protein [Salipiger mucosus]EPX75545.1 hypothetical protein Salmuc_03179 [Salipiger mucosus DSM 16094]